MPILLNGAALRCREEIQSKIAPMANVFTQSLESIWQTREADFLAQAGGAGKEVCGVCDEYYTYNF
jgi:hypothetical protein